MSEENKYLTESLRIHNKKDKIKRLIFIAKNLDEQVSILEKRIESAKEVIKFYANKDNWTSGDVNIANFFTDADIMENEKFHHNKLRCGKKAMEFLNENK